MTLDDPSPALDGMNTFRIIQETSSQLGPRLGRLALPQRHLVETPQHVAVTSRGVVPHLAQDTLRARCNLKGVYMALEDFVEKAPSKTPPVFLQPVNDGESRLRNFTAVPDDYLIVLGLRRTPPVKAPSGNTQTAAVICTAVGFSHYPTTDYVRALKELGPDIVVGLGDIPYGEKPGWRKTEKMSGRTERWTKETLEAISGQSNKLPVQLFAPILPISSEMQSFYLDMLADESHQLAGVALYDGDGVEDIPTALAQKPRLSLSDPSTPHHILREVALGIDIFTVPFANAATDAGIALDFTFPPPTPTTTATASPHPLGVDLWQPSFAASLAPLSASCACHTCTTHHRAYLQHLLNAKEMLAWVLLQVHNMHVLDAFFAGVRASIAAATFERDHEAFTQAYEAQMPEKTGQGPRVRGYQFKSEGGGEPRKNETAYRMLDAKSQGAAEAQGIAEGVPAEVLEGRGFAEKDGG